MPTQNSKPTQTGQNQKVRITKTYVDNVRPPTHGQAFIRDVELRGFALRVTATGSKAFILEKRVHGRARRQTIGRYPDLTVEQARKQAQVLLGQIALGIDPAAEKRRERVRGVTLVEAFTSYKRCRKNLKPSTLYDYERFIETAFKDWKDRALVAISKEMVVHRHERLGTTSGPAYANHALRFLRALFNFAREQYDDGHGEPLLRDNPVDRITRTRGWYRVERRRTVVKRHELPEFLRAIQRLKDADPEGATVLPSLAAIAPSSADPEAADPSVRRLGNATVGDFLLCLLFTGLRRNEALLLKWEQIDLADHTLTLPDPKNREPLVLPLSDVLLELFEARHAQRVNEYVFPGTGRAGHLVEPKKAVAKVREWSGVNFKLHDLRRTFITIAEGIDISPYAIKRLVNHKMSSDVTAGYIVTDIERLRAPMERISRAILAAAEVDMGAVIPFPAAEAVR